MKMTSRLLLACLGAFCSVAAWADCVTREPTAKEIDFHKSTFAALRSALAPAPEKWTLKVEPERQPGLAAQRAVVERLVDKDKLLRTAQ